MTGNQVSKEEASREYQLYLTQLDDAFKSGTALIIPYERSGPLMKCVICSRQKNRESIPTFSALSKIPGALLPRVIQPVEGRPFVISVTSYQSTPLEQPDGSTQATSKVTMEVLYLGDEEAEAVGKMMELAMQAEDEQRREELNAALLSLEEQGLIVVKRAPEECN